MGWIYGAVEMCNNNGACRKTESGVMCPSYRVTKNEKDLVRGRANTLRLALSGQLGPNAITADEMLETMKLCVGCKACQNECPTSVDMAKMKSEVLYQRTQRFGSSLRDKLIAYLPHYAPWLRKAPWIGNLETRYRACRGSAKKLSGFPRIENSPDGIVRIKNRQPRLPRIDRQSFCSETPLIAHSRQKIFTPLAKYWKPWAIR